MNFGSNDRDGWPVFRPCSLGGCPTFGATRPNPLRTGRARSAARSFAKSAPILARYSVNRAELPPTDAMSSCSKVLNSSPWARHFSRQFIFNGFRPYAFVCFELKLHARPRMEPTKALICPVTAFLGSWPFETPWSPRGLLCWD